MLMLDLKYLALLTASPPLAKICVKAFHKPILKIANLERQFYDFNSEM